MIAGADRPMARAALAAARTEHDAARAHAQRCADPLARARADRARARWEALRRAQWAPMV